jgi:ribosomal protein S18 acetylase RimI-like enzyme
LRIEDIRGGADTRRLTDWRDVHNAIIPTAPLSPADVRERVTVRGNHLIVAYLGDTVVGCATVRPPAPGTGAATVIARVLPAYRRRGYGSQVYAHGLARARALGARVIETVVLETNEDGLRFALRHGFAEIERYVLPGDTVPFIDLRLG